MPHKIGVPPAPTSLTKGASLKEVLGRVAIEWMGKNFHAVFPQFDVDRFTELALERIDPLSMMQRGPHIAQAMRATLPSDFHQACTIILQSLTPPLVRTERNGLDVFFYHPHTSFVALYGVQPESSAEHRSAQPQDAKQFATSMSALHALTQRFTAEFAIRPFMLSDSARTMEQLLAWTKDPSPHVRRLCSEGCRPRLPWAARLPALVADPSPALPILEALKADPSLYVRRSVANHLGDIAKDHLDLVLEICQRWLDGAQTETRWLIRHALRHPAKIGHKAAIKLRSSA